VRKTLIGRTMCERYACHLGLAEHLVVGKSVRVQSGGVASSNMVGGKLATPPWLEHLWKFPGAGKWCTLCWCYWSTFAGLAAGGGCSNL
jgi:hypothetical protein